jgi:hypothetical protein
MMVRNVPDNSRFLKEKKKMGIYLVSVKVS